MGRTRLCGPDGGPPAPLRAKPRAPECGPASSLSCLGSQPGPNQQPPQTWCCLPVG